MSWNNCTFGGNDLYHVYTNTPAMDLGFINCSFDFTSGDVVHLGPSASYMAMKFVNTHIEGFDQFIIQTEGSALYRSFYFVNPTILPRMRDGSQFSPSLGRANSPSRLLFSAPDSSISLNGIDLRYEQPPYLEDLFMSNTGTKIYANAFVKSAGYQACASLSHICNRGYDFGDEIVGTVIGAGSLTLNRFTCTSRNSITAMITNRSDGNGLQLELTGTATGSYITLISNNSSPVKTGDRISVFGALQILSAVGNAIITPTINWFDSEDALVSSINGAQTNMANVFANTNLPNFSDGTNRYIACTAGVFTAPQGAVSAKCSVTYSSIQGILNVSRLAMFRID
ncbi:hypothetical protein ABK905_18880 [Acerihabitans sp. KWT182]|uniref:Uncharacterized protein n=1 Tax=Acerihabitans sp. KWT182 TaxID=3157919 RepID=A0AAU7Q6L7_9GAMM